MCVTYLFYVKIPEENVPYMNRWEIQAEVETSYHK